MSKSYEERARERFTENKQRVNDRAKARAKADLAASRAKVEAGEKPAPQPDTPHSGPSE